MDMLDFIGVICLKTMLYYFITDESAITSSFGKLRIYHLIHFVHFKNI